MEEMEEDENSFKQEKHAGEIQSEDMPNCGQAGDDVWFEVLGEKGEGRKKVKYNIDKDATNDVGCHLKG